MVFATQVLVPLTQTMTFDQSFSLISLMMLTMTLPFLFMIREPKNKQKSAKRPQDLEHQTFSDRDGAASERRGEANTGCLDIIKSVSSQLLRRVCSDPKWIFLFFAASIAQLVAHLYGSYLVLWLNSFETQDELASQQEVKMIFSRMTLVAIPSTLVVVFIMAFVADLIKPVY